MRHKVKKISLGKDSKHRESILRNLAIGFIRHERITTTQAKARIFRPYIEKLITRAKVDTLHNRRIVFKDVKNPSALNKLFENIAKRYVNRPGGYTRMYKLIQRVGDASEMVIMELVQEFIGDKHTQETTDKNVDTKAKTEPAKKKVEKPKEKAEPAKKEVEKSKETPPPAKKKAEKPKETTEPAKKKVDKKETKT